MSVFIGSNKPTKFYIGSQTVSRLYFGGNLVWPTYYTISVTASPSAAGSVTGGGTYQEGSSVTLNATVNSGYVFAGWKEGNTVVSTSSLYTFTATANRTITCEFVAIPTYTITAIVSPTGAGTVSGTGTYQQGNRVTLTASTNSGYRFSGWKEGSNTVSTQNPYTFTAKSNRTLTAVFVAIPTYTITAIVSPSGAGTVTGSGSYREGTTVTLTATMNDGYKFTGWQENGTTVSTSNPYSFTATANRSLTALLKSSGVTYYGTITPLSVGRNELVASTVGNYALFAGGEITDSVTFSTQVDAYSNSLSRSNPSPLNTIHGKLAATTIGNYAIFAGEGISNNTYVSVVNAYNTSLTKTIPTLMTIKRHNMAATSVGNYAIFAGGYSNYLGEYSNIVDAYNGSLTRSSPQSNLINKTQNLAAAKTGSYALFAGGDYGSNGINTYWDIVSSYNLSLTRGTPTTLSTGRNRLAATSVGNYALFAGGYGNSYTRSNVDAYNTSLTRSTPTSLKMARSALAATTINGYALFGGGGQSTVVDAYDETLTRTTPTELSKGRSYLAASTVGNYAIFAGGYNSENSYLNIVDVYTSAG